MGKEFTMNDSYLNTFGKLFFNIDENDEVKEIIEQASHVLASLITKFGEVENELCYGTSRQDDFIDTVLCLFIRKIMEQLDTINVLFSIGSFSQAQIILRSLIENIVSLEFILKSDTKKRAAAYWLEHHYQEIELGEEIFDVESEYQKQIIENKGKEAYDEDLKKFQKKKEALARIIKSKPVFQEIDNDRKMKLSLKKKKSKNVFMHWYEVCSDVKSFKGMMKETGYEMYYSSIYGGLTYETHALNSTMDMSIGTDGICLKPIRNPINGSTTFCLACTFSIGCLKKIYEYLKDGEDEKREFQKYFLDFQKKRDRVCNNLDMIK